MQTLLENFHGIGEEDTVFATGNAKQDMVAVMDHVKFDNGT